MKDGLIFAALAVKDIDKLVRKDRKINHYRLLDILESFPHLVSLSQGNYILRPFIKDNLITFTPAGSLKTDEYVDQQNALFNEYISRHFNLFSLAGKERGKSKKRKIKSELLTESGDKGIVRSFDWDNIQSTINIVTIYPVYTKPEYNLSTYLIVDVNTIKIFRDHLRKMKKKYRKRFHRRMQSTIKYKFRDNVPLRKIISTPINTLIDKSNDINNNVKINKSKKLTEITPSMSSLSLFINGTPANFQNDSNHEKMTSFKIFSFILKSTDSEPMFTKEINDTVKFYFKFTEQSYSGSLMTKKITDQIDFKIHQQTQSKSETRERIAVDHYSNNAATLLEPNLNVSKESVVIFISSTIPFYLPDNSEEIESTVNIIANNTFESLTARINNEAISNGVVSFQPSKFKAFTTSPSSMILSKKSNKYSQRPTTESLSHLMAPRQLYPESRSKKRSSVTNTIRKKLLNKAHKGSGNKKMPATHKYFVPISTIPFAKLPANTKNKEDSTTYNTDKSLFVVPDKANNNHKIFITQTKPSKQISSFTLSKKSNTARYNQRFYTTLSGVTKSITVLFVSSKITKKQKTSIVVNKPSRHNSLITSSITTTNKIIKEKRLRFQISIRKIATTPVPSRSFKKKYKISAHVNTNRFVNVVEDFNSWTTGTKTRVSLPTADTDIMIIKRLNPIVEDEDFKSNTNIKCADVGLPCIEKICFVIDATCSLNQRKTTKAEIQDEQHNETITSQDSRPNKPNVTRPDMYTFSTRTNANEETPKPKITSTSKTKKTSDSKITSSKNEKTSSDSGRTDEIFSRTNKKLSKANNTQGIPEEDPMSDTVFRLLIPTLPTTIGLLLIMSGILLCTKLSTSICAPFTGRGSLSVLA